MLGKRFEYPDILRRSTSEILERFRAGGSSLILLWWSFMVSGLLLIAAAVLLGQVLGFEGIVPLATTFGVLAGLVQMLGLLRWVYVVPALARAYADPTIGPEQREVHAAVFRALPDELERRLRQRLDALGPAPRAELLHVLMLPDFDRPDRIGSYLGKPKTRTFAELLIDCEEDRTLRPVLVGMLKRGRSLTEWPVLSYCEVA